MENSHAPTMNDDDYYAALRRHNRRTEQLDDEFRTLCWKTVCLVNLGSLEAAKKAAAAADLHHKALVEHHKTAPVQSVDV